MTEREAMVRAVCEQPDDDTVRLAFADWLEENGEPERAEFVRLQVELAKYPKQAAWLEQMPVEQWQGSESEGELLRRLDPLVKRHTQLCGLYVRDCAKWSREVIQGLLGSDWLQRSATWQWGWDRGFVSEVTLPLAAFYAPETAHDTARELFATQPVTRVTLTCRRPLEWTEDTGSASHDGDRWFSWLDPRIQPGESPYRVPGELIDEMVRVGAKTNRRRSAVRFPTRSASIDALSEACVAWGRTLVGLPPLAPRKELARV